MNSGGLWSKYHKLLIEGFIATFTDEKRKNVDIFGEICYYILSNAVISSKGSISAKATIRL